MLHRPVLIGAAVLIGLVPACSSSDDASDEGAAGPATTQEVTTSAPVSGIDVSDSPADLPSVCDLVATDDVMTITGLASELNVDEMTAGPPYDRCAYEASGFVLTSFWARSMISEGVGSPEEWWDRNLAALEDAVDEVRPLPQFGDDGYLSVDEENGSVGVLWFPSPETYVESEVNAGAWVDGPPPSIDELEGMAVELAELFAQRLEPHLPLPAPAG